MEEWKDIPQWRCLSLLRSNKQHRAGSSCQSAKKIPVNESHYHFTQYCQQSIDFFWKNARSVSDITTRIALLKLVNDVTENTICCYTYLSEQWRGNIPVYRNHSNPQQGISIYQLWTSDSQSHFITERFARRLEVSIRVFIKINISIARTSIHLCKHTTCDHTRFLFNIESPILNNSYHAIVKRTSLTERQADQRAADNFSRIREILKRHFIKWRALSKFYYIKRVLLLSDWFAIIYIYMFWLSTSLKYADLLAWSYVSKDPLTQASWSIVIIHSCWIPWYMSFLVSELQRPLHEQHKISCRRHVNRNEYIRSNSDIKRNRESMKGRISTLIMNDKWWVIYFIVTWHIVNGCYATG